MKENIYLIPWTNGTYVPCIAERKPRSNAILLTPEGTYPTLLAYLTYDAYGCGTIMGKQIDSRTELLKYLMRCGEMCYTFVKLWDYDMYQNVDKELDALFDKVYLTRMEAVRGNGAVNSAYAFTDMVTLEEYCECCQFKCSDTHIRTEEAPDLLTDLAESPFPECDALLFSNG